MTEEKQFIKSSGNVFKDFGLENSDELLLKSKLVHKIADIINKRKLTQVEAAKIIGIDQPKISALLKGKLKGFSIERLIKYLNALNTEVDLSFHETTVYPAEHSKARIKSKLPTAYKLENIDKEIFKLNANLVYSTTYEDEVLTTIKNSIICKLEQEKHHEYFILPNLGFDLVFFIKKRRHPDFKIKMLGTKFFNKRKENLQAHSINRVLFQKYLNKFNSNCSINDFDSLIKWIYVDLSTKKPIYSIFSCNEAFEVAKKEVSKKNNKIMFDYNKTITKKHLEYESLIDEVYEFVTAT